LYATDGGTSRGRERFAEGEDAEVNNYSFMLNFSLPRRDDDPEHYLDALFEAGCSDASVGTGQRGMIGLDFTRESASAEEALQSAINDVRRAIPDVTLAQAGPDLVGLTEMAEIFGFSRQNMRKYATGQSGAPEAFPLPTILNELNSWHLAEIVSWLRLNTNPH
jgi:hypothetical protein